VAEARVHTILNSLTAGEWSPEADGRVDLKKYYQACKELTNFIVRPIGGARRRAGTRFVKPSISNDTVSVLYAYAPRAGVDYILEFGHQKIRFYRNNGQISTNPELVVNGAFTTTLNNWTEGNVGTGDVAWDAGRAKFTTPLDTDVAALRQDVTVVAGTVYEIRLTIAGGSLEVGIWSTVPGLGTPDIYSATLGPGVHVLSLSSPTTLMSLNVALDGVVATRYLDDVSVKQAGPLEVVTPYLAADLRYLRFAPSADVLYIACEGYAPRKLQRTSDVNWTLSTITFRPPPTEEKPTSLAAALTLSAVTGNGITITASPGIFVGAGDVDRIIVSGTGRAVITGFTSSTQVTADVLDDFASVNIASGAWTLNGSPSCSLTPNKKEPVGALCTLTTSTSAFRAADVGKYLHIQNGIIKITTFTSATSIAGTILHKLDAVTPTTNHTLEQEAWNATDGFPVDVGYDASDRLVWLRDERVWGSVIGDYENMSESTLDDDAFQWRLRTTEVCLARWIVGATDLLIGTSGAEFVLSGGSEGVLTPTNIKAQSDTTYGSARVRALRVGGVVLFVDGSGRGLREFVFDFAEANRYVAPDLLQLAQHLVPEGVTIVRTAYQRSPDSIVWCVLSDGGMLAMTYNRAEDVVAWAPQETNGTVEDVAVIRHPDGDRDQVWLVVLRNGVRCIEFLDDTSLFEDANGASYGRAGLDSCLLYNGVPITAVTGATHLANRDDVVVIADGLALEDPISVDGAGAFTLPAAASKIEAGLFSPSVLIPMRPEVQIDGTSQGRPKAHGTITVRVYRTMGLKVNEDIISIESPITLYDGDMTVENEGWDADGFITIRQDKPYPCEVLMVTSVLAVGD